MFNVPFWFFQSLYSITYTWLSHIYALYLCTWISIGNALITAESSRLSYCRWMSRIILICPIWRSHWYSRIVTLNTMYCDRWEKALRCLYVFSIVTQLRSVDVLSVLRPILSFVLVLKHIIGPLNSCWPL